MPNIRVLKSGYAPEDTIHKTVMEWVNLHPVLHGLVLHFPNEGKRSLRFGASLKHKGMRPGVFDLFVMIGRHGYFGAWIELKSKDGVVSKFQKAFEADAKSQNYFTAICYSVDETIAVLKWYCFGQNDMASSCLHGVKKVI